MTLGSLVAHRLAESTMPVGGFGAVVCFFFQAEDGIRDLIGLEFRRVLFRSCDAAPAASPELRRPRYRIAPLCQPGAKAIVPGLLRGQHHHRGRGLCRMWGVSRARS